MPNILGDISSTASIGGITASSSVVGGICTSASAIVQQIGSQAVLTNLCTTVASLIGGGVNDSVCPVILCIDGGAADTVSYPSINGLLNGGSA